MGPVELKIVCDQQDYYAGQVLSGHVLVKITAPVPVCMIKVRTMGEGLVIWTVVKQHQETTVTHHIGIQHGIGIQQGIGRQQGVGTQSRTVTGHHTMRNQEKYLNVKKTLFESEIGQSFSNGEYRYPFTTQLPPNLPGSVDVGKKMKATAIIAYNCKATLKSTTKISMLSSKCNVTENFTVHGMAPSPLGHMGIISEEDTRNIPCCGVCCFCITSGKVKATISVNKSHFLTGETVTVKVDVANHSRKTLNSIRFSIIQRIDIYATGGSRFYEEDTDSFLNCDRGPLKPGDKLSLDNIQLTIPHNLPSTNEGASRILFVKYFAAVIFGQGSGCFSSKAGFRIPITIGPTSLAQVMPQTGFTAYPPSYTEAIITSQPTTFKENDYSAFNYS